MYASVLVITSALSFTPIGPIRAMPAVVTKGSLTLRLCVTPAKGENTTSDVTVAPAAVDAEAESSTAQPLIVLGAIVALVVLGGVADPTSVLNAQSASIQTLSEVDVPKLKPYMSGQPPERYPFPNRPPPEYFERGQ